MKVIRRTKEQILVSLPSETLAALSNCINETLEALDDTNIQTRTSFTREELRSLQSKLGTLLDSPINPGNDVEAYHDGSATIIRAVNSFGDPLDLGENEVRRVIELLRECLKKDETL